jgi:serine/threonine protein kinase
MQGEMMASPTTSLIDIETGIIFNLRNINHIGETLGLDAGLDSDFRLKMLKTGVFSHSEEIFCRVQALAKQIDSKGYLDERRIGDLNPLLETDGIHAVTCHVLQILEPFASDASASTGLVSPPPFSLDQSPGAWDGCPSDLLDLESAHTYLDASSFSRVSLEDKSSVSNTLWTAQSEYPPESVNDDDQGTERWKRVEERVRHIAAETGPVRLTSLGQHLAKDSQKACDWPLFWRSTYGILEHLFDLHALGFAHRNIMPSNIDLNYSSGPTPPNSEIAPVIRGFDQGILDGIQKEFFEATEQNQSYVAPEVWDFRQAGAKADIWSTGATLFELRYGIPLIAKAEDKTQEFSKRSSLLPKAPTEREAYYLKRATNAQGQQISLDAVDMFILTLISHEKSERPNARRAIELWYQIQSQFTAEEFSRGRFTNTTPTRASVGRNKGKRPPKALPRRRSTELTDWTSSPTGHVVGSRYSAYYS